MNRPVLIVYDVFDDQRRNRLRARLAPLADRIQQSAWLVPAHCHADPGHLVTALACELTGADRLRAYAPCAACAAHARWLPADQPHHLHPVPAWIAR